MGNEHGKMQGVVTPAGIQSMDETLQRKFAKGIQFNMKIVIRGDRNTGKTCLFQRMQGKPFAESYHPTNEIQVMSIMWSYKVTSDTVKVEVWDVVDKGRALQKKGSKGTLKLVNAPSQEGQDASEVPLDAAFLDVYKGAHGAVFVFDMTKQWTWKYVERELPSVPLHIPVIIMSNFRDMGEHRVISREECLMFIQQLDRPEGAAEVRYAESSMKDGYGLMHLHKFLSVPFLQLQQEALLQQLQVNREQMLGATEELNSASGTEDQNYELFQSKLQRIAEERRKKVQEQELQARAESDPVSPIRRDTATAPPPQEAPPRPPSQTDSSLKRRSGSFGSKLGSKFSGLLSRNKEDKKMPDIPKTIPPRAPRQPSTTNVYDFVPEGEVDTQFFEAGEEAEEEESEEESDEDEADNPLVAMAEDLSSPEEEEEPQKSHSATAVSKSAPRPSRPPATLKSAKDVELTESEEEEDSAEEDDAPVPEQRPRETKKGPDPFETFLAKPSPSITPSSAPKSSKKKSTGLLLAFPEPSITVGGSKELQEKEKGTTPAVESPDLLGEEKRERKKKKSKKSKQKSVEDIDTGISGPAVTQPAPSEDPFGLTSSLNAWLNADVSNLGEVLQPTKVSKSGTEVGQEEEEEEGEEQTHDKKRKKHKHRRHREDGEGSHRRKHKHRSRKSDQTEPGDYIMDI